jgi:acyl-CoA thioesterase-2
MRLRAACARTTWLISKHDTSFEALMAERDNLPNILDLEPIEVNLFRGYTPPRSLPRIYGGQVVAQSLVAAYKTVENRICHSLQCYFIRPGDPLQPVLYQVERSRDGSSFTTRRVIAIQKGEQIFNLACSFQIPETGFDHQSEMPAAPPPESVLTDLVRFETAVVDRPEIKDLMQRRPIDTRPVDPIDMINPQRAGPTQMVWFRTYEPIPDDIAFNQCVLAYASDYALLGTSIRPHGVPFYSKLQTASLDHAIWFHRPTNFHDWHLYVMDSPSASGARGFNRGTIYRQDGVLVASTVQEGLIRVR